MVRVGDGHVVDEKTVLVAVSATDVDAGIEPFVVTMPGMVARYFSTSCSPRMAGIRSIPLMEERIRPLAGRAVTTTSFRLFCLLRRVMTNGASLLLSL